MFGAGGLALGSLTGCSDSRPDSSPPSPSGPPVVDEPALRRLSVRRLWSAPDRTMISDIRSSTLYDGVLYAVAESADAKARGLQAIDLAAGTVRWSSQDIDDDEVRAAAKGARLFEATSIVAGTGRTAVVLGTTYRLPCADGSENACQDEETSTTAEMSVVGLSAQDGSVRWAQVVVAAIARRAMTTGDEEVATVVAGDADSVVVATGAGQVINGSYTADQRNPCRTVSLDASSGRERWRVEGLLPLALTADVVLTIQPDGAANQLRREFSEVVALDRETGRRRWSTADTLQYAALVAAGPHLVALRSGNARGNPGAQYLVDPATGDQLGDPLPLTASEPIIGESDDGVAMAAWTLTEDRGYVYTCTADDPEHRRSAVAPNENTSLIGGRIHRGYIWSGELGAGRTRAIDRSGHDCSDEVPGFLVEAVDDHHLVMLHRGREDGDRTGFSVYGLS